MKHKALILIVGLVVLVLLGTKLPLFVQASSTTTYTVPVLKPGWTTGVFSDGVGPAGILVEKLTPSGKTSTVVCSNGHFYALQHQGGEVYDSIFYSEYLGCMKIASGDRNADGVRELYIVTEDLRLLVLDGGNFRQLKSLSLPFGQPVQDLAVGDVDGDGALEVVLVNLEGLYIYHATTFALEWQAPEYGGVQVRIGNLDNDPLPELVVNNIPAHILNANLKTQEWAYSGGFGNRMDLGDVDQDGRAEIAYIAIWYDAYVIDGDTQLVKWHLGDLADLASIKVADADGDGAGEVIIGNGQWGDLTAYRGTDAEELWRIHNPEHGVFGIGVGDANEDGVNEIVWGAGLSSSGMDGLFIGSHQSQSVLWASDDLDGPLYVAAGDLENDGQAELVLASFSTTSGYEGGTLRIYDGVTRQLEWSTRVDNTYYNLTHLALGQLDGDPALEILVAGDNWYETRLQVYDGLTHALEWESPGLGAGRPSALAVLHLDGDPVDEIALAVSLDNNPHVLVLNGASSVIQWDSGALDGAIIDLALGNLDGLGKTNLAVLTDESVYVFEPEPWVQKLHEPVEAGRALAVANADLSGPGELLLVADDAASTPTLFARSGVSYFPLWQRTLGDMQVNELFLGDLDEDSQQEFVLLGSLGTGLSDPSLLWIGSQFYPTTWEYRLLNRRWGALNSAGLADVDGDSHQELFIGSDVLVQLNEVTAAVKDIQLVHLPLISRPLPPRGLYGTVTEAGAPVAGIPLQVRFYNEEDWFTVAYGFTAADGSYTFTGLPGIGPGQYYYVLYQNTGFEEYRLWTWHTQAIENYPAGYDVHIGDFDLANISLSSPYDGSTVWLPATFQWAVRMFAPTDNYEFNLYDPYTGDPYFYTDPPLGYQNQYTLTSLPPDFRTNKLYAWEIWTYSPDGGFGVSYEARAVYFTSTSSVQTFTGESLPPRPGLEAPEAWLERKP